MLMKNLFLLTFLVLTTLIHAQEIDKKHLINSWKFVKMGEAEMPGEMVMIAKITDSTLTVGSQYSVSSWNYRLDEQNTIVLFMEDGREEKWIIKKLTASELVFSESEAGEFYLIKTEEDLPAIIAPVEEGPVEKPKIYSIESDYKASKKTVNLLKGIWNVETIGGAKAPEGVTLSIEFRKDFKIILTSSGETLEKGTWKLGKDGKKIEVIDATERPDELWGIKVLDKEKLVLLDYMSGEIVMKKAKKAKK
jgi:hypothetical protein